MSPRAIALAAISLCLGACHRPEPPPAAPQLTVGIAAAIQQPPGARPLNALPPGDLSAKTRAVQGRLAALKAWVGSLPSNGEMSLRLDVAERQLEEALRHLETATSSHKETQRVAAAKRALLSLKAAPLSLSLFSLDVPFAVRWKHVSPETGRQLDREARALRKMLEDATETAERALM